MALRKLRSNSDAEEGGRSSSESFGVSLDYGSDNTSEEDVELEEFAMESQTTVKRLQTTDAIGTMRRLPTRRPNPNTFNRNALMARENRRKKKEYIENLEEQVACYKTVNKRLKKLLKQQSKVMTQLRDEMRNARSSPPSISVEEESQTLAPFTCGDVCEDLPNDYDRLQAQIQGWDDLLDSTGLNSAEFTDINFSTETQKQVTHEHNYSNSCSDEDAADSGVCLHVSSGKVSLKFCAACHSRTTVGLEPAF